MTKSLTIEDIVLNGYGIACVAERHLLGSDAHAISSSVGAFSLDQVRIRPATQYRLLAAQWSTKPEITFTCCFSAPEIF